MLTDLERLSPGDTGTIVNATGGRGLTRKLDALGIRPGKKVRKVSSQYLAGPVTVLLDGRQVAMGRGIARQVIVRTPD